MSYSPEGQWLAGGAADHATHKIYIWDIVNDGQFVCTLDGGREPLIHLHVRLRDPPSLRHLTSHLPVAPKKIGDRIDN